MVKVFLPILPEIELPYERVSLDEKIMFTISGGIIFLIGQLPVYGLKPNASLYIEDPFYNFRSIFAMEKGTLLELGLLPILTSAFLWQLAAGLKLIKVNLGLRSERELFQTGQKLTSIGLSIVYLFGLLYSSYYGESFQNYKLGDSLPIGSLVLIFLQIVFFNFIMTLMVEIIDKGYGVGGGALVFLTIQYTTNFVRDLVGLEVVQVKDSNKFETFGSLTNLIKNFSFDITKLPGNIVNSFSRVELPNLKQSYVALAAIVIVIGISNYRIELSVRSTKMRGMANVYPIKLMYTGALPLLFSVTVLANVQVLGYFIANALQNPIIGEYELIGTSLTLKNGILYYLSGPSFINPFKTIIYAGLLIVLSTWFANYWSVNSGSGPKDISKQFKDQGISIAGKRDISITKELSRIIPVASVSGAFILASIAIVSELLGGAGKGISGVIGVSSAFGIMEEFAMEAQQSGGSSQLLNALAGFQ